MNTAELGKSGITSATGPPRGLGQVMNDQICAFKEDPGDGVEQGPEEGK